MGPLQTRNQRACESKDEAAYRSAGIEIADRKAKWLNFKYLRCTKGSLRSNDFQVQRGPWTMPSTKPQKSDFLVRLN